MTAVAMAALRVEGFTPDGQLRRRPLVADAGRIIWRERRIIGLMALPILLLDVVLRFQRAQANDIVVSLTSEAATLTLIALFAFVVHRAIYAEPRGFTHWEWLMSSSGRLVHFVFTAWFLVLGLAAGSWLVMFFLRAAEPLFAGMLLVRVAVAVLSLAGLLAAGAPMLFCLAGIASRVRHPVVLGRRLLRGNYWRVASAHLLTYVIVGAGMGAANLAIPTDGDWHSIWTWADAASKSLSALLAAAWVSATNVVAFERLRLNRASLERVD